MTAAANEIINPYSFLGVAFDASNSEIRAAYRKLAIQNHPDRFPPEEREEATLQFTRIGQAFDVLKSPYHRKQYDKKPPPPATGTTTSSAKQLGKNHQQQVEEAPPLAVETESERSSSNGSLSINDDDNEGKDAALNNCGTEATAQLKLKETIKPTRRTINKGASAPPVASKKKKLPQRSQSASLDDYVDPYLAFQRSKSSSNSQKFGFHSTGSINEHEKAAAEPDNVTNSTVLPTGAVVSLRKEPSSQGTVGAYRAEQYTVQLDSGKTIKAKQHELLQHVDVKLYDIRSQPELNGRKGTIVGWNDEKCQVSLKESVGSQQQRILSLKPTNVLFDKGTVIQIDNLHFFPELNGRFGTIQQWIPQASRYEVCIQSGNNNSRVVRVKQINVRV